MTNHRDLSIAHVETAKAHREQLRELHLHSGMNQPRIGEHNADLGVNLKLAQVEAQLESAHHLERIANALELALVSHR